MDDNGRLVDGLEIVSLENGETVRVIKVDPPVGEFSRRLERIMGGLLRNMHENFFVRESYKP